MTDIDKLRISLMEKTGEEKQEDGEIKSSCTVKATAVFRFNEYVSSTFPGASEEERETILSGVSDKILHDLIEQSEHLEYDYVGIWLTINDEVFENSMDISALDAIQKYGQKDIIPIYEFIKMSIK